MNAYSYKITALDNDFDEYAEDGLVVAENYHEAVGILTSEYSAGDDGNDICDISLKLYSDSACLSYDELNDLLSDLEQSRMEEEVENRDN